jgi:uncharacterized protein DUF998
LATIGAACAVVGASFFAIVVGWLHVERQDLSPRDKGISHYAVGGTYGAMTAAFVALALGLLGSVVAIAERIQTHTTPGLIAVASAAVGLLIVAAVPVPSAGEAGWRSPAHTCGALVFFIGTALGAALLSPHVRPFASYVAKAVVVMVVLFMLGMVGVPGLHAIRGWLQRACFAMVVWWLLVLDWEFAI